MRRIFLGCTLMALLAFSMNMQAVTTVRFILVGDSTVAINSGWGPGFCNDVAPPVKCLDMAKGGRSSRSYREDGSWAEVMKELKDNGKFTQTYVLLQFGHNDQPGKPGRSTDLATEFPANIKQFVEEVKAAGAKPVLVTPLSRRQFDSAGKIHDGLGPWADAMKQVAQEEGIPCLDLHADSIAALNAMGQDEANTLAMAPPPPKAGTGVLPATPAVEVNGKAAPRFDGTHLGAKGAALFAHMVEGELVAAVPDVKGCFSVTQGDAKPRQ